MTALCSPVWFTALRAKANGMQVRMKRAIFSLPAPALLLAAPIALAGCFALAGCVGSGALRGVGAPPVPQAATAPVERTVLQTAAREEKLQEGTSLNMTVEQAGKDVPAAPSIVPPTPQMAQSRPEAVQQIRAKASATGTNPPNVFDIPQASPNRLTADGQALTRAELQAAASQNAAILNPKEAEAKAAAARKLKLRAQTHYGAAVKAIEN